MRIRNSESCLHQLKGLTIEELYSAGKHLQSNVSKCMECSTEIDCKLPGYMQPLLLIDANWLAYKLFHSKGVKLSSNKCLTDRLVELACLFVGAGFQVMIVQDGNYCHHSK